MQQLALQFDAPFTPAGKPSIERPSPEPPSPLPSTATTERQKALDILAAIRTLKAVESENRAATPEERQALARFGGFGAVALRIFPDPATSRYKDASWQALGEQLQALLTPEEYASAKRTTFNAFYTAPTVMQAIHAAIDRLGVPADGVVLEPGCGVGRFMSGPHCYIGVELDSISGRIARVLHPEADIRIENFRDTKLPSLDAVIGNVPFANVKMEHDGQKFSLHDYFIAKSVDSLKPGGVLAVVTSHFTLDKQNAAAREYLAERADFLGAIRLPSDAFKREGTSVVTDIVFLRKRATGEAAHHTDPAWVETGPLTIEGAEVAVNRYFLNHPEQVLGDWSREVCNTAEKVSASPPTATWPSSCGRRWRGCHKRMSHIFPPNLTPSPAPTFSPPPPLKHITEGSFFVSDDRTICRVVNGQGVPIIYGGRTLTSYGNKLGKRVAAEINMLTHARRVLQSQNEGWPEEHRNEARRELNRVYDLFAFTYGPINHTVFSENKDGTTIRRMPNI